MKQLIIWKLIVLSFFMFSFLTAETVTAQIKVSKSEQNRLATLMKRGDVAYTQLKFAIAAEYYEEYVSLSKEMNDAVVYKLADCYMNMRDFDKATFYIKQILTSQRVTNANEREKRKIAELLARNGEYIEASKMLKGIEGFMPKALIYNSEDELSKLKRDSLNWNVHFLSINTAYREFSPFYIDDTLIFSSNKPSIDNKKSNSWDGNNYSRLWQISISDIDTISNSEIDKAIIESISQKRSKKLAGVYELGDTKPIQDVRGLFVDSHKAKKDENPIGVVVKGVEDIKLNAGTPSIDKHNNIYFSANYPKTDKNGVNRIRIMKGKYELGEITDIQALPFGDPKSFSVMHPAVNSDGTILICSSDKSDGIGGFDLYYAKRDNVNEAWGELKLLGNNVNTKGNEVFPTITENNYLYFSSDAWPGLGGLDIYKISLFDAIQNTGSIEHLSYPINSSSDDFGWSQKDSIGHVGYFTSDRLESDDDIFYFTFNKVEIASRLIIEGYVLNNKLEPLVDATVFLYNITEDVVVVAKTDEYGRYQFTDYTKGEVVIKAMKKDKDHDCLSLDITQSEIDKDENFKVRDLILNKYDVGYKWELDYIHYDFDKSNIRADARPILDSLVRVLNKYPIKIELSSHTDSRGSAAYNIALSQRRANAAVDYLVKSGINPERIVAKGYGESRLLNNCSDGVPCSAKAHQANRRTEIKVIEIDIKKDYINDIDLEKYKNGQVLKVNELPQSFFNECK